MHFKKYKYVNIKLLKKIEFKQYSQYFLYKFTKMWS